MLLVLSRACQEVDSHDTETKFTFTLPGTSGIGLSSVAYPSSVYLLHVLRELHATLMVKLAGKLQRHIAGTAKPIQNSYSSSDPDEDFEDSPSEGAYHS